MDDEFELTGPWLVLAAVRFLAEMGLLVALAWVGWELVAPNRALGGLLGLVLTAGAAVAWGAWVAPRARRRLDDPARFLVEVVLFGAGCAGLVAARAPVLAAVLAAAYVVSTAVGRKGH